MCHAHTNKHTLEDKFVAVKQCFFNSSVPPPLHVDVPQSLAEQVLKKSVGPYVFRETQVLTKTSCLIPLVSLKVT